MRRTTSNSKIIVLTAIVIASLIGAWGAFYVPAQKKIGHLKKELQDVRTQIGSIEKMVGQDQSMNAGIRSLIERYQSLNAKFPAKEETSLRLLSDIARERGIEVISVRSQPKRYLLNENDEKVTVEGKSCQEFPVTIEINSRYQDLLQYVEALRESLPAYFIVESMRVRVLKPQAVDLNVVLKLNLYLLST